MRTCCDEDVAPGDMQEREPDQNTNSGDPEDSKAERKGKQRTAGLLLHMDEGSLHSVFHRRRQTKLSKQRASLTAHPCRQTLRASASDILQRTIFGSFLFSTLFPVHSSLLLWFVKPKPLIEPQIKRTHIRKAFFIPAFEQS